MDLSKYYYLEFSAFIKNARQRCGFSIEDLSAKTGILTKDLKEYESASQIIPSNEFSLIIEATQTPKTEVINFLHDLYVLSATISSSKDLKVS